MYPPEWTGDYFYTDVSVNRGVEQSEGWCLNFSLWWRDRNWWAHISYWNMKINISGQKFWNIKSWKCEHLVFIDLSRSLSSFSSLSLSHGLQTTFPLESLSPVQKGIDNLRIILKFELRLCARSLSLALIRIELISFWIAERSLSGVSLDCVRMQFPRISTGGVNNVRPQKQSSGVDESQYSDHTHTHKDTKWKIETKRKRKRLLRVGLAFKQTSALLDKHFLISLMSVHSRESTWMEMNPEASKQSPLCVESEKNNEFR